MNPADLPGFALLLVLFSLVLGAVVSGYRDEEPRVILRGTLRRGFRFLLAVAGVGAVSVALSWYLS